MMKKCQRDILTPICVASIVKGARSILQDRHIDKRTKIQSDQKGEFKSVHDSYCSDNPQRDEDLAALQLRQSAWLDDSRLE